MCYAKVASAMLNAWCRQKWPEDKNADMASTMGNGPLIDAFDHKGGGSHKYIPADKLTADLDQPQGAGVFGYWKMGDDSYLLRTSAGPLAWWSGNKEEKAEWGQFSGMLPEEAE
jgi:hypothetical protein